MYLNELLVHVCTVTASYPMSKSQFFFGCMAHFAYRPEGYVETIEITF